MLECCGLGKILEERIGRSWKAQPNGCYHPPGILRGDLERGLVSQSLTLQGMKGRTVGPREMEVGTVRKAGRGSEPMATS